jgi:hypothetical protein
VSWPVVELVYVDGCRHAESAREQLRTALLQAGLPPEWTEWDMMQAGAPVWCWGHPSPTVLVGGRDVNGGEENAGPSCRVDGAPRASTILEALRRSLR